MNDNSQTGNVLVIPCSGVGKVHGLISREAVYHVTDELVGRTGGYCLSGLVGDGRRRDQAEGSTDSLHHPGRMPETLRL